MAPGPILPAAVAACLLLPAVAVAQPLLELDQGNVDVGFVRSGEGRLSGTATLNSPTLRISWSKQEKEEKEQKKEKDPMPLAVDRLAVHNGEIVFLARGGAELLRIRDLELTVENYANQRSAAAGGKQTAISANGLIGKAGRIALSITGQPGTTDIGGHAEIVGLGLEELGGLVDQRFAAQPLTGKLTVAIDFKVRGGRIDGTVKPTLANVGISGPGGSAAAGVFDALKSRIPQGTIPDIFGSQPGVPGVPGGSTGQTPGQGSQPLTAVIPIHGTLRNPQADLGSALIDVLRTSLSQAATVNFLQQLLPRGAG